MRELVMAGTGDATTEFFDGLAGRGYEPLVRKLSGSVRFEIADGKRVERRYVTIDKGQISVSGRGSASKTVVRADRALFGRLATGELNPVAALLRGELAIEGDRRLLVLVQRLFPVAVVVGRFHDVAGAALREERELALVTK